MTTKKVFDALLVLQYKSGDNKALGMLVKRHHRRFCRHAYRYTHDINSSKDIVQDCWDIIINKIARLKNPNAFESWAMRIVTRKSLDFVNKKVREREQIKTLPLLDNAEPDEEHSKTLERLQRAIFVLPEGQKVVLSLFYTQEYSLKEIADILEISIGTVKSRLFHAREKLKKILKSK